MTDVFPFIVGCGRSGTTLLRAMLDSHPRLAIPPESYFVVPLLRDAEEGRVSLAVDSVVDRMTSAPSFSEWGLPPKEAKAGVLAVRPTSIAGSVEALYQYYARARGKDTAGDKTPYHVRHLPLLARSFPSSRFVHLIRDGRDVVSSLVSMPFGPNRFERAVLYWKRDVEAGRTAGRALGTERYLEVRYEDLVNDPVAILRRVVRFLGVEYDEAMLAYAHRSDAVLSGLRRTSHLQGVTQPPTAGLRDWRSTMSEGMRGRFDALAGTTLGDLGYPQSGAPISGRDRVAAGAWVVADGTARYVRRCATPRRRAMFRRLVLRSPSLPGTA